MPRPPRSRAPRHAPETEAIAPARAISSSDDMYKATPRKPKDARPDSAEKENGPRRQSLRTRLNSSTNKNNILKDSNQRRAVAEKEDAHEVDGNNSEVSTRTGRRVTTTPQRRDTTGLDLDLDDSEAFGINTSIDDVASSRGRRSANRSGNRSANTSTFSISQFKRRSRAPSIIGRDEGSIRPSSRGINTPAMSSTLNIGQFKRRAREPSILGSDRRRQKENVTTDQSASENDDEDQDEDEGGFAPDAESTPLTRRKTQPAASESPEAEPELPVLKTRKRKSGEVDQEASDRPEKTYRAEGPIEIQDDGDDEDSSVSDESLPSPVSNVRGPLPLPTHRPSTPVNQSDDAIFAPPLSSSSEGDGVAWPSIRALGKRRRRADPTTPSRPDDDNLSDVSSPPSLTHSPNFPAKKIGTKTRGRAAKRQPSPKLTTAELTSMLPTRRNKHGLEDDFDLRSDPVDTAGLGRDEDELAYLDTRRRANRSRGQRPASRQASRPGSRAGTTQSALKSKSAQKKKRVSRTYGRRNDENKEGDSFAPLPDDTFETVSVEIADPKQELKKAVKKFKEVDQWALEFEEVTAEEAQPDAR